MGYNAHRDTPSGAGHRARGCGAWVLREASSARLGLGPPVPWDSPVQAVECCMRVCLGLFK